MKPRGIVLLGPDKHIEAKAANLKLPVVIDGDREYPLPFGKTLFIEPGTRVPWDLLSHGWHFLQRWDAAVPLWRYGVNASDVGGKQEHKRTVEVVRDLRVLLYAVELLFVKNNEDGRALMEAYRRELQGEKFERLAFLRAFYQVKPRLCVLPRSWMAETHKSDSAAYSRRARRKSGGNLVQVEIRPGVFVQVQKGQEEAARQLYASRGRGR